MANAKIIEQKAGVVSEIKEKFENAKSVVMFDYRGLSVAEVTELRRKFAEAYPAVLVICILMSFVIGIIWLCHILGYVRSIKSAGDISEALDLITNRPGEETDQSKLTLKKLLSSLTVFAISGIFIFDISFSDFTACSYIFRFSKIERNEGQKSNQYDREYTNI